MKQKLIISLSALLFLSACHTLKETSSQYERLPIKVAKDPKKEGRSCGEYIFPLYLFYSNTDVTVEAARRDGEINEILSIETEKTGLPFYYKICTVVKGN